LLIRKKKLSIETGLENIGMLEIGGGTNTKKGTDRDSSQVKIIDTHLLRDATINAVGTSLRPALITEVGIEGFACSPVHLRKSYSLMYHLWLAL
jgi:hypothetical protein